MAAYVSREPGGLPLKDRGKTPLSDTFGANGRLQIVLVGQPELHAKLKSPEMRQVDQRVCGYHRLAPMSRDGVAGYIHHRLQAAGVSRDRVLFPPEIALPPPSHDSSGEYLVAVGLFSDRQRADQLVDALSRAGLPAMQRAFELRRERVEQIVLGPYVSRADADSDLRRLRQLGAHDDARVVVGGQ